MPIKLLLADPSEGKLFFEFFEKATEKHQIKFHRDSKGNWHPELYLGITTLTPQTDGILSAIESVSASLKQAVYVLDSEGLSIAELAIKWMR